MRNILEEMERWRRAGLPFATATLVQARGSSPRVAGTLMAVRRSGPAAGSVSGGCVEAAVIETAREVLESGEPKLLDFSDAGESLVSVGLICGGSIRVHVEQHPLFSSVPGRDQVWQALTESVRGDRPAMLVCALDGSASGHLLVRPDGSVVGDWGPRTDAARTQALAAWTRASSGQADLAGRPIFIHVLLPRERLILFGAGPIARHLSAFAREVDMQCILIEPRQALASPESFPVPPDQLLAEWPEDALRVIQPAEDCYAVLLTHDPKIDDEALRILLKSPVSYIGALGSRKTHAARCERLKAAGFSEAEIARIQGPVGLPIGARTPAEIALSILAAVVQAKNGRRHDGRG